MKLFDYNNYRDVVKYSALHIRCIIKIHDPTDEIFEGLEIGELQKAIRWAKRRYKGEDLVLIPSHGIKGENNFHPAVIVPMMEDKDILSSTGRPIKCEGIAIAGYSVQFKGDTK